MKKVAVILSGCGVFDGAEIHESVMALLAIREAGAEYICYAPDMEQHHVLNHITGEELSEKRNVMVESARISRGAIQALSLFNPAEVDALFIPGGFGAAKNLTDWAFYGPDGSIREDVKNAITGMIGAGKPIAAVCMGPTVVAKALQDSGLHPSLTVGTTTEKSPYEIAAISSGMEKVGAVSVMKTVREIHIDEKLKIVTAPCYMMEADILDIRLNVQQAVQAMCKLMQS